MKIVVAWAGLGNMMFQYSLVVAFRKKNVKTILFVSETDADHNGYELERIFSICKPYEGINSIGRYYYKFLGKLRKFVLNRKHIFPYKLLLFPFERYIEEIPYIYYPNVFDNLNKDDFFYGTFQSYKYFDEFREDILKSFTFNEYLLSFATKTIENQIKCCNSVSIHVRRGDYMTPYFYKNFGSVCDVDYYKRAICELEKKVNNVKYFVFSDDIDNVRDELNLKDATYIDFNKYNDSWQDMYLMSKCKHNIIANSSFSFWAAYLNQNPNKIVIAPKVWMSSLSKDEIAPEEWIRI